MNRTGIEWCEWTWNPATGCTPVSEGCAHCYAGRMARRLAGRAGYPADDPFRVTLHPERLAEPLRLRKPSVIFVCSMSDLFHAGVPDDFRDRAFAVMALCPHHRFVVLTKRLDLCGGTGAWEEGMATYFRRIDRHNEIELAAEIIKGGKHILPGLPLSNVFLGVSVENQARANERLPYAMRLAAAGWRVVVSHEPALGLVDWRPWLPGPVAVPGADDLESPGIAGLICGGETGAGARPMHPDLARAARDQCQAAGVPFFFKQWGEWAPGCQLPEETHSLDMRKSVWLSPLGEQSRSPGIGNDVQDGGLRVWRVGRRRAGRLLDGRTHDDLPWSRAEEGVSP